MRKFYTMKRLTLTASLLLLTVATSFAQRISGRVTDARTKEALAGVTVLATGTTQGATTDGSGSYSLPLKAAGTYTIRFSAIGSETRESKVTVGAGESVVLNVELTESNASLSEVVVVGSRSTQVRTSVETVAPVDVIQSRDLAATGQVEPTQQLNFVAPSFNSSRQTVADGTDHIDPATIRGLGPDQVLVLLNGKRRHNQALVNVNGTIGRGSVGTDLNALPATALERVEVLRDGAASQYGSDAIAGVINLRLKEKIGTSVNAQFGQQYAGDGRVLLLGVNHGFRLGKEGVLSVTVEGRSREATNRAGTYTGPVYFNWVSNGAVNQTLRAQDEARIAQRGFSRENNMQIGNSAVDNVATFINMRLPLSKTATFYANGGYNYRRGIAAGFYRYPFQNTQIDTTIYRNGYLPQIQSTIQDYSGTAGLSGKSESGWNWDVSAVYGGNQFRFDVKNSLNASLARATTRPDRTQSEFYAGTLRFNQLTTDAGVSRDFGSQLGLNSFNVAGGLSYRVDNYQISAGEETSWQSYNQAPPATQFAAGAQVFPGFRPTNAVNATRNVFAAYVDVESDITSRLLLNAATRFENYSDFGGNVAWKVAGRYKIVDEILSIRGSISTGFRAPSMHQRLFSAVSTQFVNVGGTLTPLQVGTFRNGEAIANAFGIPQLKAERSLNYALGLTSRPVSNLSITVDAYQIDITDRIVLTGQFQRGTSTSGQVVTGILDGAGARDVNAAAFFTNAINTRTRGLDVVVSTSPRINTGKLDLTLAANFNRTDITELRGTERIPNDNTFGNVLFNRQQRGFIELANPRSKITLGANYTINKLRFNVRATRFGEVGVRDPSNAALDETYSPKIVTDINIGYALTKAITIAVGANNALDVYPDKIKNTQAFVTPPLDNTSFGRFVYSRNATQFGFNGGYYFVNLTANF
ncbi:TonB-dependent receptor [Rudanella lutea]|uniref:TonB-dependent receptor n=1 Tax=Rudanella lutea TaxID=451374 RepID=UPI00035C3EBF|nr:TonB-dependent receptor [Rudanella lutea]